MPGPFLSKVFGLILSLICLAIFQTTSGLFFHHHESQSKEEGPEQPIIIYPPKDVYLRHNFNDFLRAPNLSRHLDLFLQAFRRIQDRPSSSPVSYFQLAGIHGRPFKAWNGVHAEDVEVLNSRRNETEPLGGIQGGVPKFFAGYCLHASILFPTWHRAYTLLMEQEIRAEALSIAREYNQTERMHYLEAAHQLRMPYWDWTSASAAEHGLPDFILKQDVEVQSPQGKQIIRNPLEAYTFGGNVMRGSYGVRRGIETDQRIGYSPSMQGDTTLRQPDESLTSQYDIVQDTLRYNIKNKVRPAWQMLLLNLEGGASWARFATHPPREDRKRPLSSTKDLEGIHDIVHDVLGGVVPGQVMGYPGHASDVNVAAYDPLFFLQHAHLDRLVAEFQLKHPDVWIEETYEPHLESYMHGQKGGISSKYTPLWPFRKTYNRYFDSNDIRNVSHLGYGYPSMQDTQ